MRLCANLAQLMPTQDARSIADLTRRRGHLRLALIHTVVTKVRLVITPTTQRTTATKGLYNQPWRMFRILQELEWSKNTGEVALVHLPTRLVTTLLLRRSTWAGGIVRQRVLIRHLTGKVCLQTMHGPTI